MNEQKKKIAIKLADKCSRAVWDTLMLDARFTVQTFGIGANCIADDVLNLVLDRLTGQDDDES